MDEKRCRSVTVRPEKIEYKKGVWHSAVVSHFCTLPKDHEGRCQCSCETVYWTRFKNEHDT